MKQKGRKKKEYKIIAEPRRLIRVGNSLAVTLPPRFVEEHNLREGDEVGVVADHILKLIPMKEEG